MDDSLDDDDENGILTVSERAFGAHMHRTQTA